MILRRVALVDQNKIGLGISVFVSVESADHSEGWLRKFADAVSAMPEVMEFYRMAGDVDYMLRVVVADMQSYDVFYKKLIGAVPLKNVTSRFAMEKIKSVTALPVPAVAAAADYRCRRPRRRTIPVFQRRCVLPRDRGVSACAGMTAAGVARSPNDYRSYEFFLAFIPHPRGAMRPS